MRPLRRRQRATRGESDNRSGIFWLHVAPFGVYNALIGHALHQRGEEALFQILAFFALAIGLRFVVIDFGLLKHYRRAYGSFGRGVFGAADLSGRTSDLTEEIFKATLAPLLAFLAGGVILNLVKEEVPEERGSQFWAFAVGVSAYAALLLAV